MPTLILCLLISFIFQHFSYQFPDNFMDICIFCTFLEPSTLGCLRKIPRRFAETNNCGTEIKTGKNCVKFIVCKEAGKLVQLGVILTKKKRRKKGRGQNPDHSNPLTGRTRTYAAFEPLENRGVKGVSTCGWQINLPSISI